MSIEILFVTAKNWHQPRYPSVGEWLHKLYSHTLEYYLAIKQNKLVTHENLDESLDSYAEQKRLIPKGHILYDPIYITFLK